MTAEAELEAALTPGQRRTLDQLRRGEEAVVFDERFVDGLVEHVRESIDAFAGRLGDRELWMSKHRLASVLGCEAQATADDPFTWSPAVAGGQVAHRAVQLGVHWRGDPVPAVLVDEAMARVAAEDSSLGIWLDGLGEADRADLRGLATERVTKFFESFPPLDPRSRPMTEARVQWPLQGPILLSGKVDLVLGKPAGRESRKVIVDLKTGAHRAHHREDLRFYALVETLRTGVPPRKLASFYLDVGAAEVEDVTEGVLRAAVRRTLDGIHAWIELTVEGRDPVLRPGPTCRWCPLLASCDTGRAHLEALAAGD